MVRAVETNLDMIRHVAKRLGNLRDRATVARVISLQVTIWKTLSPFSMADQN